MAMLASTASYIPNAGHNQALANTINRCETIDNLVLAVPVIELLDEFKQYVLSQASSTQ